MEIVQHGAALGLGVAAMASRDEESCKSLMELLYHQDSAIAGEAAGVSLGLVMLGSGLNEYCQDILTFSRNSQHEKIIRGLSIGLALMMYSREEEAEPMIEALLTDKDPILRYGAMFMIGLAYCGTANNNAISRLLHVAVSDVNNDVRRAAVIAIGFVLFRRPSEVPKLVSLLSESYNPHVRYGAALALGIACAGTGMKEAIDLLDPLTKDQVPFVKQGAWIALSMVLIQISKKENPRAGTIRDEMLDIVEKKNQPLMAKFGAILGLGIIDAGGRNVTISLSSTVGHKNLSGIVGITVFLQYWYWYPYIHFISLAFTPTAIVAVNKNLQKPKYNIKSNAPPSYFSYPPSITPPKEEEVEKLPTAQLSTTKKAEIKKKNKKKDSMDIEEGNKEEQKTEIEQPKETETKKDETETKKEETETKKVEMEIEEPSFQILTTPARVTRRQLKFLSFDIDPRYKPISEHVHGIIVLNDSNPAEKEDLIEFSVPSLETNEDNEEIAEAPAAFYFNQ